MRQNIAAPFLAVGSATTGLAALVIGLFSIGDCVRFQRQAGQCTGVVEEHVLSLASGLAAVAGPLAGFFTLNPLLDRVIRRESEEEGAGLGPVPHLAVAALAAPSVLRMVGDAIQPEPERGDRARGGEGRGDGGIDAERVQFMHARGLSDEQIAEATGLSPRRVARILGESADLEPGL